MCCAIWWHSLLQCHVLVVNLRKQVDCGSEPALVAYSHPSLFYPTAFVPPTAATYCTLASPGHREAAMPRHPSDRRIGEVGLSFWTTQLLVGTVTGASMGT